MCDHLLLAAEDVDGCMTPADISESLSLTTLRLQNWHIQGCSALTGKGWVASASKKQGISESDVCF